MAPKSRAHRNAEIRVTASTRQLRAAREKLEAAQERLKTAEAARESGDAGDVALERAYQAALRVRAPLTGDVRRIQDELAQRQAELARFEEVAGRQVAAKKAARKRRKKTIAQEGDHDGRETETAEPDGRSSQRELGLE